MIECKVAIGQFLIQPIFPTIDRSLIIKVQSAGDAFHGTTANSIKSIKSHQGMKLEEQHWGHNVSDSQITGARTFVITDIAF